LLKHNPVRFQALVRYASPFDNWSVWQ
jgi:hypothetical protein